MKCRSLFYRRVLFQVIISLRKNVLMALPMLIIEFFLYQNLTFGHLNLLFLCRKEFWQKLLKLLEFKEVKVINPHHFELPTQILLEINLFR